MPRCKLDRAVLRTTASPAAGERVDPTVTTAPFVSLQNLTLLQPALGCSDVRRHVARPLASLLAAGATPAAVLVPIASPGDVGNSEEPELHPMLFVPDGTHGGWLVSLLRWEEAAHAGARSGAGAAAAGGDTEGGFGDPELMDPELAS